MVKKVFKNKDFLSSDGMLTHVWGPSLWHSLHIISFNYPNNPTPKDKIHYRNMIINLKHTLPCKYCRINLRNNLKCLPLKLKDMKNRNSFSTYVYKLHELINKMLNKKSYLTYNDVKERYEHFRARCKTEKKEKKIKMNKNLKEIGCTTPLYGAKSKCIIKIVPKKTKCKTFQMSNKCKTRRLT